ncbi:uncharacterized protein K452DRAFT_271209 [Aplosporella prunicola CBS 121167]|uniref:NADAR domain-containing protein n=1 Tax=Aplosporella prunicola CBS 121167 TaxID=1176127 RepID=A0A6A6BDC6_9PEZI|nr:uncharacterized protein K452DRAFT_271209 [Aplosporella prunicola CBS 121167]KAF2141598.1 hypothetical protein K452DRAFT_271209 [Aplosporella prunicola CBS 121167]
MPPLFFHKPTSPYGFLCQWHCAPFTDNATAATFSSAEQYMMYRKAALFNDSGSQAAILRTHEPRKQKSLGRKVQGFDADKWDEVKLAVVEQGNLLRFSQNPSLRAELLATGGRELVEASPFDRVWGIGFGVHEALSVKREEWGQNLLGEALMRVRERLGREERKELEKEERGEGDREGEEE